MARQVVGQIRLQVTGGQATPAPPVGPALGQHGVNIGAFVTQFNDRTKEMRGITVPVVITVYSDRSFEFIIKSPPAAELIRKEAGIEKGSGQPNKNKVGKLTRAKVRSIAETKMADLNANTIESAMKMIEGTARSMGVEITG